MEAAIDTLAASRKLEQSGMPQRQAEATAELVNDAMSDLVTKQYLSAELDRRFSKFERKMERKMDERFKKVDEKILSLESDMKTGFADVRVDAARSWKFMMATLVGTSLTLMAVQLAMLSILLQIPTSPEAELEETGNAAASVTALRG